MGEYAIRTSDGEKVKIGTCEDMYYLRAEQRAAVSPLHGNVNPSSADALALRFRFPWPDEDGTQPGEYERYDRALAVDVPASQGIEHYSVQFVARAGYVVSLPCPESLPNQTLPDGTRIGRNGFSGGVLLEQQKLLADGRLVPVCRCGGCGSKWRMEEQADIEALAVALRAAADRKNLQERTPDAVRFEHLVADRVLLGALVVEPVAAHKEG